MPPELAEDEEHELDRLVREAVWQARDAVAELESKGKLISRHYRFPQLSQFENGQPQILFGDGPTDFAGLFKIGKTDQWSIPMESVPAIGELGRLAVEDDNLRARALAPGIDEMDEWREGWVKRAAAHWPLEILDRLMNTVGGHFDGAAFDGAWTPLRNGLLWDWLPVDVIVPIALAHAHCPERRELAPGVSLEPIPEGEQLARASDRLYFGVTNDLIVGAATHAFAFHGYKLPGPGQMLLETNRPSFYPRQQIELAFQALRLTTDDPVGYAQMYIRPNGWASEYKANLPPVIRGAYVRRYPSAFDDYGWLRAPHKIDRADIDELSSILQELHAAQRSLKLAARRFSGAALREEVEDAILDLCIALEAGLGDGQRTEMTYKLGMRASAVMASTRAIDEPGAVLRQVKRLYDWRSALAHGGDEQKARKRFNDAMGVGGEGVEAATGLVRTVLRQLVEAPELRDPLAIDAKLVAATTLDLDGEDAESDEAA